jgi:hypothetical protein
MGSKTAIAIVSRHELLAADGRTPGPASGAISAWYYRWNNHCLAEPMASHRARGNHTPRNFMTEDERKRVASGHAIVGEANVGVADSASSNFHDNLIKARLGDLKFVPLNWCVYFRKAISPDLARSRFGGRIR